LPEFSGNASFLGRPRAGSNRTADTESEAGDNASVEFVMAGDLTKSGRPKRPSLRRMFTSSIFHSRGFFSQKSTDIKDSDFISQNMHWLWTQALLLQTMFFNMDHDRLIDHVKDFVSVLLAHNLPKDSRLVQLMALIAHAVSPKYSKIKPNFSTETVEQMEKEMNTLESWDQNYLFGVLYQVTALAFISKGSYDEGKKALQQAQSRFLSSNLATSIQVYHKHVLECKLMLVDVEMNSDSLGEASNICRTLSDEFSRASHSPQVELWIDAWSAIVRFRRCGILVTLAEISTYEESVPGAPVQAGARLIQKKTITTGGANGAKRVLTEDDSVCSQEPAGLPRRSSRRQSVVLNNPDLLRQGSSGLNQTAPAFGGSISGGLDASLRMGLPTNVYDMGDERMMRVDQILLAAMRAWKLGDRNSPGYNRSEAIQYATVAWNLLLDTAQTPMVWYLGIAYEMLFYSFVQVVHFQAPPSSKSAHRKKRLSATIMQESVKHLCKSFKTFADTFSAYKPIVYRCKGLLYALREKSTKAASCFRKAAKTASKMKLNNEEGFAVFLLQTYCHDVTTRHDSGLFSSRSKREMSVGFAKGFGLTMKTWKTGAGASAKELMSLLAEKKTDSISPKRRSIVTQSIDPSRLRRRSSSAQQGKNGNANNTNGPSPATMPSSHMLKMSSSEDGSDISLHESGIPITRSVLPSKRTSVGIRSNAYKTPEMDRMPNFTIGIEGNGAAPIS